MRSSVKCPYDDLEKKARVKGANMDKIAQLAEKKGIKRICEFLESGWFPVAFAVAAFLFYALNIPIVTVGIFAVCGMFICLFCRDTLPGLTLVLLVMFSFRYKDNLASYLSPVAIVLYIVLGIPLVAAMFYRLCYRRVSCKGKFGLLGVALFCVALLLGGVFTKYYTAWGFVYALAIATALFGVYAFFAFTLENREGNLTYLAKVLTVGVCLISAQVLEIYLRKYQWGTPLDSVWKGQLHLGWSISNMVAEMIVFALPAVFFLIYQEEKGYWYWLVVVIGVIAVFFTLGRNALLWAGLTCIVGAIVNCIGGKNKKVSRILVLCALGVGLCGVAFLYFKGYLDNLLRFFLEVGLDDRGRFENWEKHIEFFLEYPVLGAGFDAYADRGLSNVIRAHNNLVQMLSSTGIVGLGLYLVHRAQTVYCLIKKPSKDRLFIGGCIAVALLMGMLSSTFFHIYSIVHYSLILLVLEKSGEE